MEPVLHRFNVNTREQVQPFQVSFQLLVQTQNFLSPPLFSLHRGEAGCPPSLPALYTPPFKVCGPHPCVGTTLHPLTSHHTHTHRRLYVRRTGSSLFLILMESVVLSSSIIWVLASEFAVFPSSSGRAKARFFERSRKILKGIKDQVRRPLVPNKWL